MCSLLALSRAARTPRQLPANTPITPTKNKQKQYTFILTASKGLPSQVVDAKGRTKHRRSVGVRMPADAVCQVRSRRLVGGFFFAPPFGAAAAASQAKHKLNKQNNKNNKKKAVLEGFGGALLSHSVHVEEHVAGDPLVEAPDVGALLDAYGGCGLDFIVDAGPRIVTASTVIDMTGAEPELVRQGAGDARVFGFAPA